MHREIVANSPQLGMTFMYHRRDGLWLFRISTMDSEYIVYEYKYYKGGRRRDRVELEELVDWCKYDCQVGWSRGSSNSFDRWKMFISRGSEESDYPVRRVILVDYMTTPSWEV